MTKPQSILIVGAGIYGITAALELAARGHAVQVFDPGPLPHPDAATTDISKVLRMDYGSDEFYWDLMLAAFDRWDEWNKGFSRPLWHQTGFLMLSRSNWQAGGFEYDSFQVAARRGLPLETLDEQAVRSRFPAWNADLYQTGYYNPRAGWAESGEVLRQLIERCPAAGIQLHANQRFERLLENGSRVGGIQTADGTQHHAEVVIFAAGAWTPALLPHLEDVMWATGQPVYHFRAPTLADYQPPRFPVWNADIANTGWYGFPAKDDGTLKVANHGPGWRVDPHAPRLIPASTEEKFREFFRDTFPGLVDAPKIGERLCLYCDTWDGNFWIDFDPQRPGLLVAAGDSGHGFKFAPMYGEIIADLVEGRPNPWAARFAWREPGDLTHEDARFMEADGSPKRK